MSLSSILRQSLRRPGRSQPFALGFIGLLILILGTLLVQITRGSATVSVYMATDQETNFNLWIFPMFGLLMWCCSLLAGGMLVMADKERRGYLVLTLWWSGIGMEILCLGIILSYL